ncbi:MAG: hypothetical protein ACPLRA_06125, partial [Candidatus Saccharicenans sp.]
MIKKKKFCLLLIILISCALSRPGYSGLKASPENFLVFISPACPTAEKVFRVILVSEARWPENKLSLICRGKEGQEQALRLLKEGGGPPFWQWWQGKADQPGVFIIEVMAGQKQIASQQLEVFPSQKKPETVNVFWKTEKSWGRNEENLFSSWLEALFYGVEEKDSWPDLHSILQDPDKNFLHNHLGLVEDDGKLKLKPDCADNPFFLRAYFSWKNRLPFGFHECSRGSLFQAPAVGRWLNNELPSGEKDEIKKFSRLLRLVMDTVHSGTARTRLTDDRSDYYPLPLSRNQLRPGTVYADPYGHTLVIVRWVPQTEQSAGLLLAVDAQPDGTIGLKRFWKGNFLFAIEEVVGQPGFKAFRPIIKSGSQLHLMTNKEIQDSGDYGNFSLEQQELKPELFYQKMERLINPEPLDPEVALRELYRALYEQLLVRVESVENGEKYLRAHPHEIIPMPSGSAVFLATGPWEDFSTPNRDLRLLI